ncbi:hypothetical protein ABPG77_006828 [Micractinium sp. CCAP 211/92]
MPHSLVTGGEMHLTAQQQPCRILPPPSQTQRAASQGPQPAAACQTSCALSATHPCYPSHPPPQCPPLYARQQPPPPNFFAGLVQCCSAPLLALPGSATLVKLCCCTLQCLAPSSCPAPTQQSNPALPPWPPCGVRNMLPSRDTNA